jgi:hypothetical protein
MPVLFFKKEEGEKMKINGNAVRGTVVALHDESFSLRTERGEYLACIRFCNGRRVVRGSDGSVKMTKELVASPKLGGRVVVVRCTVREGVIRMWADAQACDSLK